MRLSLAPCIALLAFVALACGQPFVTGEPAQQVVPTDGLLLWLRADQGITLGGAVSRWADQSGHHMDASQTDPSHRPARIDAGIGGHPSVGLDGVDDYLALPPGFADFTRGLSIVAVVAEKQASACTAILELSNGSEIDDISFGQYQDRILYEVFDHDTSGDTVTYDVPRMVSVVHGMDETVSLRQNGRPAGTASFALPAVVTRAQCFVGRTLYSGCAPYTGQIGEVIVYGRALGETEIAAIEADLRMRWSCCS